MSIEDILKELANSFRKKPTYKDREIKRVFQWRRYLEWKDLTYEERISAKRLLLLPIGAYLVFIFINQYAFTLIFMICIYFAYKKFKKGWLSK